MPTPCSPWPRTRETGFAHWNIGGQPAITPRRQFRDLLRHLIARYDVPAFLDAAWLEGLTAEGVKHQGWYKHIARGQNISTAEGLPIRFDQEAGAPFPSSSRRLRYPVRVPMGGDHRSGRR